MDAGLLSGWAAGVAGQVRVTVRFPDLGWEVDDWSFSVEETPEGPAIVVEVYGADFDYPGVVRRLKRLVDLAAWYNFVE